jgi:hypothetical protein
MKKSHAKRVIVRLGGRLANQMFQYAAGKALAGRLGAALAFEGYGTRKDTKHQPLVLSSFKLRAPLTLIEKSWLDRRRMKLARRFDIGRMRGLRLVVERGFDYDERFEQIQDSCYLIGGWQSFRYFAAIEAELVHDFSFKGTLSASAQRVFAMIQSRSNTIGIHVRRGDYVGSSSTLARHGICGVEYYQRALAAISARLGEVTPVIFSDDIERARNELSCIGDAHYVAGTTPEEDLHLMGRCQHNIIANSTFSWWAAWLNPNPAKIVVAPQQWFGPALRLKNDTKDLFPDGWILLSQASATSLI